MENKRKVYISLPISGYDIDERRDTAMKMEIRLRGCGFDVFNPLGDGWVEGLTTQQYMKRDLKGLLECDTIMFLKGFNHSAGCHTEMTNAFATGMDIWFEEQVNMELK